MCVGGDWCVGMPISLAVGACVSWKGAPRKGAYMLYILYIEHTIGTTNQVLWPPSRPTTPTCTLYLVAKMKYTQALMAHL